MGTFKGLGPGNEDYEIEGHIWELIGDETANATHTIPSAFVRPLGNVAENQTYFTAESWGFWFIHLAPALFHW